MVMTPSSFSYEHLSSLKFKELQKLSVQFHVNKRWAKKQELIENLLALKEKNETVDKQEDEQEWRDASTVFSDLNLRNENKGNKRLTYNVTTKSKADHNDPHLTFEVPQNGKNLLCETVNSRETYDIPPGKKDFGTELLKESRATFEVPPKKKLTDGTDSRATFDCNNGEKSLKERTMSENKNLNGGNSIKKSVKYSAINIKEVDSSGLKQDLEKVQKFNMNVKNKKQEKEEKKPEVKLLTIPYARVTRRTKAGEASKNDTSSIKMSKKSINIKKSTRLPVSKADLIKSPFSSTKKSINKQTIIQSLTKNQPGEVIQSKMPIRLQFTEEKSKLAIDDNKENVIKISRRRISKSADEAPNEKLNLAKVNFRTPPPLMTKNSRVVALKKTPLRKVGNGRLNAGPNSAVQTPGNKPISKSITATKMPDFSKIHKKQFEQMDSLHDYLKKKEDRIRKLFGTPQPGQQLHNLNKSAPIFHFQSMTTTEKENKKSEVLKSVPMTPLKKKENDLKFTQKEAFKSKLRTDIKDKNRSHIHGVRTNKRFELQMKFRNV